MMIRGLYTAATGLNAGMRRQDTISNNLANANTPGFKRENTLFQQVLEREIYRYAPGQPPTYLGQLGAGVNFRLGAPDMSAGPAQYTGRNLDILIDDPHTFLVVEHGEGQAYTRNGHLHVDDLGFLRTSSGAYVLGEGGNRLQIPNPDELAISADGTLIGEGGKGGPLGRLQLVAFEPGADMQRLGDSLWLALDGQPAENRQVIQGALEQANVQVIKEMVNLITAMRAYELNTKLIQVQDQTLEKAVNDVGRA